MLCSVTKSEKVILYLYPELDQHQNVVTCGRSSLPMPTTFGRHPSSLHSWVVLQTDRQTDTQTDTRTRVITIPGPPLCTGTQVNMSMKLRTHGGWRFSQSAHFCPRPATAPAPGFWRPCRVTSYIAEDAAENVSLTGTPVGPVQHLETRRGRDPWWTLRNSTSAPFETAPLIQPPRGWAQSQMSFEEFSGYSM